MDFKGVTKLRNGLWINSIGSANTSLYSIQE